MPKLELTWVGKDARPRLEPRLLVEDEAFSHAGQSGGSSGQAGGIRDNLLIQGDNLLALKALEADFAGRVKCVFIDPPYNTGSAFEHYDDGLEHSIWLSMMRDRLEVIRNLLAPDGSLWVTLDDNEAHYFKVMADEVFGRGNFVASFLWKKVDSPNDNKVAITPDHEYVLCYSKDKARAVFRAKYDDAILAAYRVPDEQSDRPYRDRLLKKNGKASLRRDRPSMFFAIVGPDGAPVEPIHDDGQEARWALGKDSVDALVAGGQLVWKQRTLNGVSRWVPYTREYAPDIPKRPHPTIWSDLHTTRQTKAHQKALFGENGVFDTPKPENLIERILAISTNPGDLVLDSFAGSGTTGAVAHKMGRRWVMVEIGDHARTHIVPRLKKVIDGHDPGGVTGATGWQGGGAFRFLRLAPSLIARDTWGREVISPAYGDANLLAQALCKLEGFRFEPSETEWWVHGRSSEADFLHVTTQTLSHEQLAQLSELVGEGRTLLVLCAAWRGDDRAFSNLTVRKIPDHVLKRCDWGRDDYALPVAVPPALPTEAAE